MKFVKGEYMTTDLSFNDANGQQLSVELDDLNRNTWIVVNGSNYVTMKRGKLRKLAKAILKELDR